MLLVAVLLGSCNVARAERVGETFLNLTVSDYLRNPMAFPESGTDFLAGSDLLAGEQAQSTLPEEVKSQVMRGETWLRAGGDSSPSVGIGLWGLIFSTFASLICGGCLSLAGTYVPRTCSRDNPCRRRIKTERRMLAG